MWSHDIEVTPADIRQAWGRIMDGENPFSDRQNGSCIVLANLDQWRSEKADEWIGATGREIDHRLTHGYAVEEADIPVTGGQTEFVLPTMLWDEEEGDLFIDQVLSGEDAYRVQWEEVEAPKSLTIRACIGMHAGTLAEVLGDYMTWLLKVVDAAQRRGVTPTVELWIGTNGSYERHPREKTRIRIPLVKSGEIIDVDSWRAYLTPGAFRSLGFVAMGLAADRTKNARRLTYGLGSPTNQSWNVTVEDGVMEVECPGGASSFPEEHMNRLMEAAGV
jgi:hypothetical protein